ncbi:MAG: yxaF [Phycisphaerales bacterium]|nr:yxaF [Phycisphaerales bacterium]
MADGQGRKEQTREAILRAASTLFRRDGYHATGVDKVMAAVGLTAGGFYAHFRSKSDLLAAVLGRGGRDVPMFAAADAAGLDGVDWVRTLADQYLSPAHRDGPATGCLIPALGPEVGRADPAARAAFEAALRGLVRRVVDGLAVADSDRASSNALAIIAMAVGAQVLARGVADEALSDQILAAARGHLETLIGPGHPTRDAPPPGRQGQRPRKQGRRPKRES